MPALGIEVESPQPDEGGARTCNEKPDPCGNAQNIFIIKKKHPKMGAFLFKSTIFAFRLTNKRKRLWQ